MFNEVNPLFIIGLVDKLRQPRGVKNWRLHKVKVKSKKLGFWKQGVIILSGFHERLNSPIKGGNVHAKLNSISLLAGSKGD